MKKVIVCIIIYHFMCLAVNHSFYTGNFLCADMKGFAMNRNAFAMQVMCTMLALVCCAKSYRSLIAMNVALYFTFSRTAHILAPVIYTFIWWTGLISRQQIQRVVCISIIWIVCLSCIQPCFSCFLKAMQASQASSMMLSSLFPTLYSSSYSDNERWYTIVQGLQMWKDHLWFGAGLGAFVQNEWLHHQRYLMIHNSYIWILAEMGVVGAAVWGAFAGWIGYAGWRLKGDRRFAVLSICFVFCAAAMVHEVIYQRIFWWILGLLLGSQPECLALPQGVVRLLQGSRLSAFDQLAKNRQYQ